MFAVDKPAKRHLPQTLVVVQAAAASCGEACGNREGKEKKKTEKENKKGGSRYQQGKVRSHCIHAHNGAAVLERGYDLHAHLP